MSEKNNVITENLISELESLTPSYLSSFLGMQFKNHRDFYTVFGWERRVYSALLTSLYENHGIAKAVNNTPVNTTWRTYPTISSTSTSFNTELATLNNRLKLYKVMRDVDRVSGIGSYGVIVLQVAGQKLDSPLKTFKIENLRKLSVYKESDVQIFFDTIKNDDTEYNYKINHYKIGTSEIHPSRIIHVAENSLDGIYGESRIAVIYNQLNDLWKVSGSSAEQFYISASLLLNAKAMDGFKIKKSDGEDLQDSLYELVNKMKGFLVTSGFDIQNIAPPIVSPKDSWEVLEKFISATSGIPRRILFGSEMGQLASSQDQTTYYERIESRQVNYVTDEIIKKLIDKIQAFATDFSKAPYTITWQKLSALSDKEVSESVEKYAISINKIMLSGAKMPENVLNAMYLKIEELITNG